MEWSQTYPGLPSMVSAARAFVRSMLMLDDSPRTDDAVSVISELFTNSLRHSPSGGDGGDEVKVVVSTKPGWARVAVLDAGTGEWERKDAGDYGHGLILVEAFADQCGHVIAEDGQTAWAEFGWSADE